MRIAVVTPDLPWPAETGGKLRSYHLLRGLAQNHGVDLYSVCYGPPPDAGPLRTLCCHVEIYSLRERYSRRHQVRALTSPLPRSVTFWQTAQSLADLRPKLYQGYDLLVCDEVTMAPYLLAANASLAKTRATPRLMLRQKIDSQHYTELAQTRSWGVPKWLDWVEARRLRRYEVNILRAFQAAVVCSPDDGALTQQQGSHLQLQVIPNGADTDYLQPIPKPDPLPTLLFLGTMHYYPNVDAVLYFFNAILPLLRPKFPDLQIFIVGHDPPPEIRTLGEQPGVTITGRVADVRPYLARSWLMIVPLRLGGGTRLKITEAMAAGLPVVSTTVGAQGLAVVDGEHLLLADTPATFAQQISRLLNEQSLHHTLGEAGRKLVESNYSWQALGRQFVAFCEEVSHLEEPTSTGGVN